MLEGVWLKITIWIQSHLGRSFPVIMIALLVMAATIQRVPAWAQTSPVTAEPLGQANVRAAANIESTLIGEIRAGTRYPVIGRSALYPWVLITLPGTSQPYGWVFRDLVTIQGDLNSVPITEQSINSGVTPPEVTPLISFPSASELAPTTSATAPAPVETTSESPTGVTGAIAGEVNIRYGPGVEYPRVGVGRAGDVFTILMWHTQFEWVQIRYPQSPNGLAWIALNLLEVEGDLYSLPSTSQTVFNLPTLTPTPGVLEDAPVIGATPVPLSPEFRALGDQLWAMMLESGFDPQTSKLGAMFLMDLQTGEAVSFGSEFAFSGTSVNKISILTALYSVLNSSPDDAQAYTVANSMVCSENISTNQMLSIIGDGDPYTGANRVSDLLQQIGLQDTFIYTPFANDPYITPQAPRTRITEADQQSAEPDPYNQMTVNEMGGLLNSIYQCAANGTGPLVNTGTITQTECRQMLHVMNGNRIGNLIEAGVPAGVPIAHKHGWIDDTHGDAALVFSPGGAYIFVVMLHNPVWLEFVESEPLIEEMSRTVYNYFNPDAPMLEVRSDTVPARCDILGSPIITDLMNPFYSEMPTPTVP